MSGKRMKITDKAIKALAKLNNWENGNHHYNLYHIHDMEMYSSFSNCDALDMVIKEEYLNSETIKFRAFANARDGSEFAIWLDATNDSEPPVVYLGSDGELKFISISMEKFLCKIAHGYSLYALADSSPWSKDIFYDDLVEFSEGQVDSEEEMKALVAKEIDKFSSSVDKTYNCTENSDEKLEQLLREKLKEMALY